MHVEEQFVVSNEWLLDLAQRLPIEKQLTFKMNEWLDVCKIQIIKKEDRKVVATRLISIPQIANLTKIHIQFFLL